MSYYKILGYVTEDAVSVARTVRLYERSDCTLLDKVISTNGQYEFIINDNNEKQVVALSESTENDLIYRITPTLIVE